MDAKTVIEEFAKSVIGKNIKIDIVFDNHNMILSNYDSIV